MSWPKKIPRINECGHPERKHKGLGMCDGCYARYLYRRLNPEIKKVRLEKGRAAGKEYYARKHGLAQARHQINKNKTWALIFEHYGHGCACCGELHPMFLTLDHINGDGSKHRKSIGGRSGYNLHRWLVNAGFPIGFQILCYNCNCGKSRNGGVCPHKEIKGGDSQF